MCEQAACGGLAEVCKAVTRAAAMAHTAVLLLAFAAAATGQIFPRDNSTAAPASGAAAWPAPAAAAAAAPAPQPGAGFSPSNPPSSAAMPAHAFLQPRQAARRGVPAGGSDPTLAAAAGSDEQLMVSVDALGRPPAQPAVAQRAAQGALGASAAAGAGGARASSTPDQWASLVRPCFLRSFRLCIALV